MNKVPATLVCEDGRTFTGVSIGSQGAAIGRLLPMMASSGYQEFLTSGEADGAIVLFTTPHIGNVGTNDEDAKGQFRVAGVIMRERPRMASNWRATRDFTGDLIASGTVGIAEIDTRALLRHLRNNGPMKVGIFSGSTRSDEDLLTEVRAFEPVVPASTVGEDPATGELAVIDLGSGQRIAQTAREGNQTVAVLGADASFDEVQATGASRVIISGGPGAHTDYPKTEELLRALVENGMPVLALGVGHLLLAGVLGAAVKPLDAPHFSANHPVRDLATQRVLITAHSHDHTVVLPENGELIATHVSLNDNTVEGFQLGDRPVFGLQFHVGEGFGSSDVVYLFDFAFCKDL